MTGSRGHVAGMGHEEYAVARSLDGDFGAWIDVIGYADDRDPSAWQTLLAEDIAAGRIDGVKEYDIHDFLFYCYDCDTWALCDCKGPDEDMYWTGNYSAGWDKVQAYTKIGRHFSMRMGREIRSLILSPRLMRDPTRPVPSWAVYDTGLLLPNKKGKKGEDLSVYPIMGNAMSEHVLDAIHKPWCPSKLAAFERLRLN